MSNKDLRASLGSLVGIYGVRSTYQELMTIMREEYEFLHEFYSNTQIPTSPELPEKKSTKNKKIKVVAEEPPSQLLKTDISGNSIPPENTPPVSGEQKSSAESETPSQISGEQKKVVVSGTRIPGTRSGGVKVSVKHEGEQKTSPPETSVQPENVMVNDEETPKRTFPFYKKNNLVSDDDERNKSKKEELMKKREELQKEGKTIRGMMTKENLEKWLSDGETYISIGKKVGLTPMTVSKHVDRHGLSDLREIKRNSPVIDERKDEVRKEIDQKKVELNENGISGESLMTKENLEKWINEGMTYESIAKEKVGLPWNTVKNVCEGYGLISNMAKMEKEKRQVPEDAKQYLTREEEKVKRMDHNKKVAEKRAKLIASNIKPMSLATKVNLEKWLSENWTYWKIAEETGVDAVEVSKIAKGFGLKRNPSDIIYSGRE